MILRLPAVLLLSLGLSSSAMGESGRRALIIAIGDYPSNSGWKDLASDKDALLMAEALAHQQFEEITTLSDKQATAKGMIKALDKLASQTDPGDTVVLHYSGHGYTAKDDNGDEQDFVDELIVGHDALKAHDEDLDGYIRDDLLGEKLDAIRLAAGPEGHVLFLFDSCHSGTITRSVVGGSRSSPSPVQRKGQDANPTGQDVGQSTEGMASYVVISAARYDQSAIEAVDPDLGQVGSLSLAFSQALADLSGPTSYRALYERIRVVISRNRIGSNIQTPQIEGDVELTVLSGTREASAELGIRIDQVQGESRLVIAQGHLHGLAMGSRVEVHSLDADPTKSKALATGAIEKTDAFSSVVKLDEPAKIDRERSWALVTEPDLGERRLNVQLEPGLPEALVQQAQDAKELRVVESGGTLALRPAEQGDLIEIDGCETCKPLPVDQVLSRLRMRALSDFVRDFEAVGRSIAVALEFVLQDDQGEWTRCISPHAMVSKDEAFRLRVHNTGYGPVRLSVTAVTEDDVVYRLWPDPSLGYEALGMKKSVEIATVFPEKGGSFYLAGSGEVGGISYVRVVAISEHGTADPPSFESFARITQKAAQSIINCTGDERECPFGSSTTRGNSRQRPVEITTTLATMEIAASNSTSQPDEHPCRP